MEDSRGDYEKQLTEARRIWDAAAASFDDDPDHGLHDSVVREAWTKLLTAWLPAAPAAILDVGCGTGSLSVVIAGLGCEVTGIDLSPAMIAQAEAKATALGRAITFYVMEAAAPQLPSHQFDVIVCRHLLWTLPEPGKVLLRWVDLLRQNGRLVLIEGYWHTGAGMHAQQIVDTLPSSLSEVSIQNLSGQSDLWGGEVVDERYAIIADLRPTVLLAAS
jgi:SAM-dependent methyltransferase